MRRVVVTGIGAVTPCGLDTESSWKAILNGKSGIGRITQFDATLFAAQIAGEVKGFDPERYIEKKRVREMARFIHLAVAASEMAIESGGFEPDDELKNRTGTFIGVGFCGVENFENTVRTLVDKGPRRISPYFVPSTIANLAPGQVSMRWQLRGPSYTNTSACSSGAHSIGEAFKWIQRGGIDAAVCGGAEAAITPVGVGGFAAMKALSTRNDEPERASRPFDKDRDGFVIAEGAGILLLEERDHAMKRGAKIYAEIVGYGATADAFHLTQPAPEGEGAQRAMKMALADAGRDVREVEYINAHGTSTPNGDMNELKAIHKVFGSHVAEGLWVSSTKSMTGHLLGAAGGLEGALCVLALDQGVVPPTINLESPDPECGPVDLVPHTARERKLKLVLSNSFGFGGTNATLVFAAHS
jgi:3-oxoacyl-[acyl-carrier-protein] synthase II